MCGIAGVIRFKDVRRDWGKIEDMTAALNHRGPDATDYYNDAQASLGHKRLAIIDLSPCANQPLADFSGRYRIVFNGEIYNFRDLKELIPDYPYKTSGDTELILAAYLKWGPECLQKLAGMFAFAIWDTELDELFIARDRLGVKPLYYYESADGFLFASEIRALLASGIVKRNMDKEAITDFLLYQSTGDPDSIVKDIKSVEPGTYLIINGRQKKTEKYWNIVPRRIDFNFNDPAAVKRRIHQLLLKAVERRMVSDVPIGAFLSGGIDSSAIVGLMASLSAEPVNTFTIGFDEKEFDESNFAKIIAGKFNTRHNCITLKAKSFLDDLIPALDAMDTPSGDGINSFVVSKAIRNLGITVALSGIGGDELFAGYPIFGQYTKLMRFKSIWKAGAPFRNLAAFLFNQGSNSKNDRLRQILKSPNANIRNFYPVFRQVLSPYIIRQCTTLPVNSNSTIEKAIMAEYPEIEKLSLLSQVSVAEYLGYTKNTLLKDIDQMSMAVSLEVREPFFDHDLIEFMLNVPDHQKFQGYPKKLLVESLDGLLPSEIVHREKKGFVFPWNKWMREDLASFCESHIRSICEREFIKQDALLTYWNKFLKNDPSVRWLEIWQFVILEYWLKKNNVA